jgi:sugar-specific transcriptional regulator TrmB
MNAKANTPLSFDEFAKSVGKFGKDLQSSAKPLADAYAKATPEQQADLKARWMLNHLIGQGIKNAEAVIKTGKSKQASREHIKAIDRAYSDFAYNIKQSKKTKPLPDSSARQVKVVAPRKVFNTVFNEVIASGMTKQEFAALIAELKEAITFE